nr:MAG TPA: hypothetical protein [Caudoviricetes sp.]DAV03548.1 MAG TPA: hypothetical protein [Caudoviricetes sp.]
MLRLLSAVHYSYSFHPAVIATQSSVSRQA